MRKRPDIWAPYRNWAKRYSPPKWDLAGSYVQPCTLEDVPGALEAVELNDRNEDGYAPLVRALARRYGTEPENVLTAHGATGAAFLALAALIRPGDKVMVEWPSYDPIAGSVRLLGGEVVDISREWSHEFAPDPDQIAQVVRHDIKAIVLTNPHDPTGVYTSKVELMEIGALADAVGAKVIVDEVYLDALSGVDTAPAASLGDTFISLNSLTKSYGLAGLRLGWMLADVDTTEKARAVRDLVEGPGPVPVERMGVVALGQMDRLLERARAILEPNLARLVAFVEGRPELAWVRPVGAVAFPRLEACDDADPFVRMAHDEFGVGVVPGSLFGYRQNFRISVAGPPEVVEGGLEALERALDKGVC